MIEARVRHSSFGRAGMAGAFALLFGVGVLAQESQPEPHTGPSVEDLRGLESEIEKAVSEQRRLNSEIENASAEAQKLRATLIEVARRVRSAEERMARQETRLVDIESKETTLRRSLQGRERVTAEVLAAMQRIGRKPPPALLVQPDDVLSAMRAAVLMGAVVPEMRDEARVLITDLKALTTLADQSRKATADLRTERDTITTERATLTTLVEQRQQQMTQSRVLLEREKARMAALSRDAKSLRELIAKGEADMIGNARALEIARRAPPPVKAGTEVAALATGTRLGPRQPFAQRRGQLFLPVSGEIARRFGARDGVGGVERGMTIASNSGAVVTAPADGWVHFAAPFRGYGQLLIINAGNGYHIVLAGMERLSVEIGQFVLAGEPVGFLPAGNPEAGTAEKAAGARNNSAAALGSQRPALYVEFRKDGSPVDPSPWWSLQSAEKARG